MVLFVPTLLGVSIAIFTLLRVIPGDVAALMLGGAEGEGSYTQEDLERVREQLGLNDPIYVQYGTWIWQLVRFDLGDSIALGRPIAGEIKRQFPITIQLAAFTAVVVSLIAIPVGVLAAVKQDTWIDYILRSIAVVGLAAPSFFVGMLIILGLSLYFRWIPPIAFVNLWDNPTVAFQQLIFPAVALGFASQGLLLRMTRTQLLEVLREDFVRTARAKGLEERAVIMRHGVRNALLPVVTIAGVQVGFLFSGTVVIETVFNVPGIGRGLIQAMFIRDLPMIQAYIMYFALVALTANFLVDLTYAWLDPRIRYG